MSKIIINDDLYLQRLAVNRAEEIFRLIDNDRSHLRSWLPWVDATKAAGDVREFIRSTVHQHANGLGLQCQIHYGGDIIGVVGFHPLDKANKAGAIGYWLASSWQGKGIMTQSVAKMVQLGFDSLDLHRIEIKCAIENHRSRAIPQRLGFVAEGTQRDGELLNGRFVDLAVYAKLRTDSKP